MLGRSQYSCVIKLHRKSPIIILKLHEVLLSDIYQRPILLTFLSFWGWPCLVEMKSWTAHPASGSPESPSRLEGSLPFLDLICFLEIMNSLSRFNLSVSNEQQGAEVGPLLYVHYKSRDITHGRQLLVVERWLQRKNRLWQSVHWKKLKIRHKPIFSCTWKDLKYLIWIGWRLVQWAVDMLTN